MAGCDCVEVDREVDVDRRAGVEGQLARVQRRRRIELDRERRVELDRADAVVGGDEQLFGAGRGAGGQRKLVRAVAVVGDRAGRDETATRRERRQAQRRAARRERHAVHVDEPHRDISCGQTVGGQARGVDRDLAQHVIG